MDSTKTENSPELSLFLPVLDEEENLRPMHAKISSALDSLGKTAEVIYVDDGSTDKSLEILKSIAAEDGRVRVISLRRNYGQTAAMSAGIDAAKGEILIPMDADLQNDPADIATLLPLIRTFDLVCGWRKDRHDNLTRKISSRIANAVRSAVTGDRVHDTGCSLKLFRRSVVDKLQLFEGMHRFFPALALMHGFTVAEVPVRHYPRAHGTSKYGVGNRLFKGLYDLAAVRWMQHRCLRYHYRSALPTSSSSRPASTRL